jgi:hypothetical protein
MSSTYHLVAHLPGTMIYPVGTCCLSGMEGERARHSSNHLCHAHLDLEPGMLDIESQQSQFEPQVAETVVWEALRSQIPVLLSDPSLSLLK